VDVGEFHEDAESAEVRAQLVQEGAALHDRGVDGEKTAAEQALKLFEDAVEEYPDDPMLKAYYGSSVSLVGRYAEDANATFAAAIKGIKIVDEAVKMAPGDVRVRLVRAKHCMRLPELFFRRTAVAIVDLEFVRERAEQSDLSKEEWLEVLWMLGSAYLRLGIVEDAKATWNALLEEDPDGPYRAMIDAELAPASVDVQMNEVDLDDKEAVLREGIRLHDLAVKGSREAASKALELIQRAY